MLDDHDRRDKEPFPLVLLPHRCRLPLVVQDDGAGDDERRVRRDDPDCLADGLPDRGIERFPVLVVCLAGILPVPVIMQDSCRCGVQDHDRTACQRCKEGDETDSREEELDTVHDAHEPCNGIEPGRVREEQRDDPGILAVIRCRCKHRRKVQQEPRAALREQAGEGPRDPECKEEAVREREDQVERHDMGQVEGPARHPREQKELHRPGPGLS